MIGQSSNLHPYRAGVPTYDWWRPTFPRQWRGHPVDEVREILQQVWDPAVQKSGIGDSQPERGAIQRDTAQ